MFLMAAEIALNTQANPNATETPTTTTTIADRKYLRELQSNFPHFPVQQQVNKLCGKFSVARSLKVKLKANVSKYFSGLRFVHFVLFISFWFGLLWLSTRGTVSSPISVLTPQVNRAVGVGAVGVGGCIDAAGIGCSVGRGIDAASVGCCVGRGSYIGRGSAVGRKELRLGSSQSDDGEKAESELKERAGDEWEKEKALISN